MQTENNVKTHKEPFLRIIRRSNASLKEKIIIYAVAVVVALFLGCTICGISGTKTKDPFTVLGYFFQGVTKGSAFLNLLGDTSLLLLVSLAILPAFKMKYWNLGANGQVLIAALFAFLSGYLMRNGNAPQGVVLSVMFVSAVIGGMLWGLIPAILKAFLRTNESLVTLMMNYIAIEMINLCNELIYKGQSQSSVFQTTHLPGSRFIYFIATAVVVTLVISVFLKRSKQGYEIAVVGESESTAKYIGINNKAVIIRTMLISGAICGIVGFLLMAAQDTSISTGMAKNMGFTGIMTVWLAKFNPIMTVVTCLFITFIQRGTTYAGSFAGLNDPNSVYVVVGVVYFIIIACDFLLNYKLKFNFRKDKKDKTGKNVGGTKSEVKENKL